MKDVKINIYDLKKYL